MYVRLPSRASAREQIMVSAGRARTMVGGAHQGLGVLSHAHASRDPILWLLEGFWNNSKRCGKQSEHLQGQRPGGAGRLMIRRRTLSQCLVCALSAGTIDYPKWKLDAVFRNQ